MHNFLQGAFLPIAALAATSLATTIFANDRLFLEKDGLVVMEIENTEIGQGWNFETDDAGYTGSGYLTWRGPQSFNTPGRGVLEYRVLITNPGNYNLRLRCRRNQSAADADNDAFIKVNNEHWEKIYSPGDIIGNWSWNTKMEERGHSNPRFFLPAGENIIRFSGRSQRFKLDRMVLFLDGVQGAQNLSLPESELAGSIEGDMVYDFRTDTQGWTFEGTNAFTRPAGSRDGDRQALNVRTSDNTNTFGWWQSPQTEIPSKGPGFHIYEAQWRVRSDVPQQQNPTLRFRASRPNFSETFLLESVSSQDGAFGPYLDGRTYRQFFSMPDGNRNVRYYFDVLNVDRMDAAVSNQSLDFVASFNRTNFPYQIINPSVLNLNFRNGQQHGFTFGTAAPAIPGAGGDNTNFGLGIGGEGLGNGLLFGFWSGNTGVAVEPNSLYEFRFVLTSNAPASAAANIPTTRVRVNDSRFYSAHSTVLESTTTEHLPTAGNVATHRVWVATDASMGGSTFITSMDWLNAPGTGNDPNIIVYLQEINIARYALPAANQ